MKFRFPFSLKNTNKYIPDSWKQIKVDSNNKMHLYCLVSFNSLNDYKTHEYNIVVS